MKNRYQIKYMGAITKEVWFAPIYAECESDAKIEFQKKYGVEHKILNVRLTKVQLPNTGRTSPMDALKKGRKRPTYVPERAK